MNLGAPQATGDLICTGCSLGRGLGMESSLLQNSIPKAIISTLGQ